MRCDGLRIVVRCLLLSACCLLVTATWSHAATATLTWTDASTNELGFTIERKTVACGSAGTWAVLGGVGAGVATYKDLTVVEGGAYCYRVNAWNTVDGTPAGTKQFSAWSNEAGLTVPFAVPQPPAGLGVVSTP